jgi:hypothetical protein
MMPASIWFLCKMRYELTFLPFWLIAKIQGRKFRVAKTYEEIKSTLTLTDKGRALEELFSCKAFYPIISLESVNHQLWERVRNNFLKFKDYLPHQDKLGEIARQESEELIKNNKLIDSPQISKSTVKIFLKWLFCENHKELNNETCTDPLDDQSFNFVDSKINDNIIEELFNAGIEFRKHIAVKGYGCMRTKQRSCEIITKIFKESKYSKLFDWDNPECYSIIMQPFVISPMINMSDIAVSLEKNKDLQVENYDDFVEHCIYIQHPFPFMERYDKKTNTQIFIDFANLKNYKDRDYKGFNFGHGIRSCLGRSYAKIFMKSYFEPINKLDNFKPHIGHLFSGRDNDKFNLYETLFQLNSIIQVIVGEVIYKITNK